MMFFAAFLISQSSFRLTLQEGVHPRQAVDILRQTINPDLLPHDVYNLFSSIRRMRTAGESSDNTSAIRKRRSEGGGGTRLEQNLRGFTGSPGGPFMDGGRNPMMPEINQPRHPPVFPGNIMTQPLTTIKYREAMTTSGYGNEHSVIEVRNLGGNALVGTDIWGGRDAESRNNRFQPILFSAKISLRNTFDSAAQIDKLNDSTVNYSLLSKAILKLLTSRGTDRKDPKRWKGLERDWSIYDLLNWAFLYLTGRWINGGAPEAAITHDYIRGGVPCLEDGTRFQRSLLNGEALQELELTLFLPKGTLLSGGVSLTVSGGFLPGPQTYLSAPYRSTLKIQDIQIPTLIGLNPNERTAKQMVIATVEIDPYLVTGTDYYNELEQIITKVSAESSLKYLIQTLTFA
jgi:dihydroneopterin aldolase